MKGKKTELKKANAVLIWVQKYLKYENYGNTRKGAFKTYNDGKRKGNCVDSTHLVVALLRAQNIRTQYGVSPGHAWPLVKIGGKWKAGEATLDKSTELFGGYYGKYNFKNRIGTSEKFTRKYIYTKKWGTKKTWVTMTESYYYDSKWHDVYTINFVPS
nr:transglutaminase-like domain-containing protein [Methanobrevibacter cuticularis]